MREKLFLSYSTGDADWRDLFLKHIRTMLSETQLFVDKQSLRDGADWKAQLTEELARSKCALLLLTPQYLEVGNFAQDEELPMLLEEHQKPDGLKLLPVLVENCAYTERPELGSLQLVGWDNNTKSVKRGTDTREVIRALKEAGDEARTPRAGESAIDQAVKEVCERAKKEFGVIGQITQQQREHLFETTKVALQLKGVTLGESIHSGDFAVIYRGTYENQEVAVKALPTDAWRNRVRTSFDMMHRTAERLRDASFIRVKGAIADAEVHAMVLEYVDWPTLADEMKRQPSGCLPPQYVVKVLAKISVAQQDAHKAGEQIGALSPTSIYVNPEGDVRLTPLHPGAQGRRRSTHRVRGRGGCWGCSPSRGHANRWSARSSRPRHGSRTTQGATATAAPRTTTAPTAMARPPGRTCHATYGASASGSRASRALPRIAMPVATPVAAAAAKERSSKARIARSTTKASSSPSSPSRFRCTSCQMTYGCSVASSAATTPIPVERRRVPISRTSSAVRTATTICARPTASQDRPNGK